MRKIFIFLFFVWSLFILNSTLIIPTSNAQWSSDIRLTNNSAYSLTSYNNARCVATNGNIINVVWYDDRDGHYEVYHKRSTDGGINWSADTSLTLDSFTSTQPSIYSNGSSVHLAWYDNRDGNFEIYYKNSTDDGLNWGPDMRLTNATGNSISPSITVSGTLIGVVWNDSRDGNQEIYYKYSTDGGMNWNADVRLTNNTSTSQYPSIAISGSVVHTVWYDNRDGNNEIYYKRSTNGGVNWGADTRLTVDSYSSTYSCISSSDNLVFIVWADTRNTVNNIYYKISSNGGLNWGNDTKLSNASGTYESYPSVFVTGKFVHIVWVDTRDGNQEIYYKRSLNSGTKWGMDTRLTAQSATSDRASICVSDCYIDVVFYDTRYGYEILYKRDITGNPIYAVDSTSPFQNKINVPISPVFLAYFHQTMNSSTMDTSTVTVFGSMTGLKQGTIFYNTGNNTLQFTPTGTFKYGEVISVSLDTGIKTSSGRSLIPFVSNHTTQAKVSNLSVNQSSTTGTGIRPIGITTLDFNRDGYSDLAVTNTNSNSVSILKNNGTGIYTISSSITSVNTPIDIVSGDFNNDGYPDLAFTRQTANAVSILINNGTDTFSLSSTTGISSTPYGITTSDFDGDGYLDIATTSFGANLVSILRNSGTGSFSVVSTAGTGASPRGIASGDFDNNGYIDLCVANGSAGTVSVLINNRNNSFSALTAVTVGTAPDGITTTDLDNDKDLDIIVTNYGAGTVSVLKNNGTGTLSLSSNVTVGSGPYDVVTGDYDGDGDMDMAVSNYGSNTVTFAKNTGTGAFVVWYTLTVGTNPYGITAGDYNGDGVLDAAVCNYGSNNVSIISNITQPLLLYPLNNSVNNPYAINFQWTKSYGADNFRIQIATDSLFNNLILDNATIPVSDSSKTLYGLPVFKWLYWRMNSKCASGSSLWSDKQRFRTGYLDSVYPIMNKVSIQQTDARVYFDQVMNASTIDSNSVTFWGSLTGKKQGAYTYEPPNKMLQITPSDSFKYGEVISIILDSGIKTNTGSSIVPFGWSFTAVTKQSNKVFNYTGWNMAGAGPNGITSGDFDRDGDIDVAVANQGMNTISILSNNGAGTFSLTNTLATGNSPAQITTGDFNNDGYPDLAVTNFNSNTAGIYLNDGTGLFNSAAEVNTGSNPYGISACDLNNDGYIDFATANTGSNNISILNNDGTGNFTLLSNTELASQPKGIITGDFDGDGYIELGVTMYSSNSVCILENNGVGIYSLLSTTNVGTSPEGITAGDFDNNGYQDIATVNYGSNNISILKNNGNATFTVSSVTVGNSPYGIATGDIDGDSDLDICVTNYSSGTISVLTNNGTGVYTVYSTLTLGTALQGIALCDYSGDGTLDLAIANYGTNGVSILSNLTSPKLLFPYNNSTGNHTSFTFYWSQSSGASNYRFQLSTDSLFNTLIINDSNIFGTTLSKSVTGLSPLTGYFWQMNSKSVNGLSLWSETYKFKTHGAPLQASLYSPENNSIDIPINLVFKWYKTAEQTIKGSSENGYEEKSMKEKTVTRYWFELVQDTVMMSGMILDSIITDTVKYVSGLEKFKDYYWRVKSKNEVGWGSYSGWSKFKTGLKADYQHTAVPIQGNNSVTSFGATDIIFTADITTTTSVTTSYFSISPMSGQLPAGIISVSKYYWTVQDSGIVFSSGRVKILLTKLSGVTNPYKLVWLKRSFGGERWTDIGGTIQDGYLSSTVTFSSFSEFAIASQDSQPLQNTLLYVKLIPAGFYNASMNILAMSDTVTAYLRNINPPYSLIDSAKGVIDSLTFISKFIFKQATTGSYYIVIKHRNSLEVWSKTGGIVYEKFTSMNYDFTSGQSQTYGSNSVQIGSVWCMINGDCNGDNYIDGSDYLEIFNHYDEEGYLIGDTNGDMYIDGSDYLQIFNYYNIGAVTPLISASPTRRKNINQYELMKQINKIKRAIEQSEGMK